MCSFPELAKKYSDLLSIPYPTIDLAGRHLRAADMLTIKGYGRGGADMTARDAAALLVALIIDHARSGDFAAETANVLGLPLSQDYTSVFPDHFAHDLSIAKARNAGEAIEFLFRDVLRDRIRRPMEEFEKENILTIAIDPTGASVSPGIAGPNHPEILSMGIFVYRHGREPKKRNVERNTILHGRVILEIAKLLKLEVPEPAT